MFLYIKMLPLIKVHTRRFHVTTRTFLRKIVPKTSSNNVEQDYSRNNVEQDYLRNNVEQDYLRNNVDPPYEDQTSSPDYLGIESDEGVIVVNPQKHASLQAIQTTRGSKEKFHCTTFGVVRYDTDNKIKFHGQYGKKHDFTFPRSSSENTEVSKHFKKSNDCRNSNKDQSLSCVKKNSVYDEIESFSGNPRSFENKYRETNLSDNYRFNGHELEKSEHGNSDQMSTDNLNFVEREYFGALSTSEKMSVKEKNASKNGISDGEESVRFAKKDQDFNYFDECYFGNSKTENFDHNNMQPATEDLNFIDKDYFKTLNSSNNLSMSTQYASESITKDKKNDAVFNESYVSSEDNETNNIATNESSFLEENYFGDFTASQSQKSISNEFSESTLFNENTSHYNNKKPSDNDEIFKSYKYNDGKDLISNDVLNSSAASTVKISDNLFQNMSDKPYRENTFHKLDEESSKQNTKEFPQNEFEKSTFSPKILKSDTFLNETAHSSDIGMKSDISDGFCTETLKPLKKENNFNYSQVTSEDPNQSDEISTAHDFVKKLRKEQGVFNQSINKGKDQSEEKLDSKGFRILKNQVPDLSHFTQDEILTILKQNIVYSDDELLVLNKPYNLVMHESQTTKDPCLSDFLDGLAKLMDPKATNPKLFTVHRLDKETTGCLLLARTETMAQTLKSLFAQRKIIKKYWIITVGVPDPEEGVIDIPISEGSIERKKRMVLHPKLPKDVMYESHSKKGKSSVTSYKVLSQSGNAALVEATPITGLKHQIRVHFGFGLGCPVLGDHKYSYVDKLVPQKLPSDMLQKLYIRQSKVRHIPMHIHAKSVVIPKYFENRNLLVNIPLPEHMKVNLKRLKFRKRDMIK